MPDDPAKILLADGSPTGGRTNITVPWLVTVQFQFRIDAATENGAAMAVMRGTSFNSLISPTQISQAIQAQPLTKELLASLGIDLEKK